MEVQSACTLKFRAAGDPFGTERLSAQLLATNVCHFKASFLIHHFQLERLWYKQAETVYNY